MGRPLKDLSGQRFGRWLVLFRDPNQPTGSGEKTKWLCICDCNEVRSVFGTNLRGSNGSRSCGCLQSELIAKRNTKHGTYGSSHYWNWFGAQKRAKKLKATPVWADLEKIKLIYKNRPAGHHVDHIVPLNSPVVCGLHWEGNLQYLPARENLSKRNKLLEPA